MEFIQLKEVGKSFKKLSILNDVNLTIQEGEIFGIIGQSGSGKTTLLNLIAGFIEPSEGEIVYYSKVDHLPKNLNKNFNKIKKHIGYTPQHTSFYPKLTVQENLIHFGRLYGLPKNTILSNAESLLGFTGLSKHKDKLAENLSGGMQKRLDLSCSLIHKPKLLLLDEPTSDLDPVTQEEIVSLIQEVNRQGITVVIASHHLDSLEKICSKLMILHNGTVKSYGDVEEVRKPFQRENFAINIKTGKDKEKILELLKKLPLISLVEQEHQIIVYPQDVEKVLPLLLKVVKEENLYLHDIDLRKTSLNEVFAKLTQEK